MSIDNINLPRVLATSSAIGLVLASAGFGAVYAYKIGIQHSILLAGLSVLMALALEAVKPLAMSAGLSALRDCKGSPLLLLTLAGISCAYSLTSELSLVSMGKGDLIAERQAQSTDAGNAFRDRQRIEAELAAIGITRPSAAIQAELDGGVRKSRIAPLQAELATAERRELLEAKLNGGQTIAPTIADPGSVALATYLALLGFKANPETISQWLILVPVLALEIGSLMAHVLVQAFPATNRDKRLNQNGLTISGLEVVQPENTGDVTARERVKTALVDHLKANGGEVAGGERGLAKLIGSSRGTMKRAINGLLLAGLVTLEASKTGTVLRLAT